MRYKLYREHKYVSAVLNDLERMIARADFSDVTVIVKIAKSFDILTQMLKGHAQYENERIHVLLEHKKSNVHVQIAGDHADQDGQLAAIKKMIDEIAMANNDEQRIESGYQLYLAYRAFVADNLHHMCEEERRILPELQRLYSDVDLQQIEAPTYLEMTADDMVHMMQVLFPEMNPSDRQAMLTDIHDLAPKKFVAAWQGIAPILVEHEQELLRERFEKTLKPH